MNGLGVCGSVFHNVTTDPDNPRDVLQIRGARDVAIRATSFRDNTAGPDIQQTHNVSFVRNEVVNHTVDGLVLFADPGTGSVRFNNFAQNNQGEVIAGSGTDASRNWWGHPSGPKISGESDSGEGEPLRVVGDNVTIDPVLTSPAVTGPDAVECGVLQHSAGVKQGPTVTIGAHVEASAEANATADAG